jgi:aspartyl-tRNA(Asn)/glutamyl-tRNA(Gln) amidotransferase subunit A
MKLLDITFTDILENKLSLDIEEYVYKVYENINKLEPKLNAFITLRPLEEVINEVKEKLKSGKELAGVLVAVKDNISTMNLRTTCASKMLENYIPPFNATVIERLLENGATIIGKTNMDEFAMGSTTENSYFKITRNPWDLERVPGGSSGGSAVAVSAKMSTFSLGSDTGGSIRLPSAYTGIFGLKPTYGTVSRYGLVAYANSLEQIGPMARNANDLWLGYYFISGDDLRDATTVKGFKLEKKLKDIKEKEIKLIVISDIVEASSHEVKLVFNGMLNKIVNEVGEVREVRLKYIDYVLPTYYIIAMSEASSNLARFDGLRYGLNLGINGNWKEVYSKNRGKGFGKEVKKRIMLGSFILSSGYFEQYYVKALKTRRLITEEISKLVKNNEVIIHPTSPFIPPKIGEVIEDPLKMYALDIATVTSNLTGMPSLSFPAGIINNLPIGVQIMSSHFSDYMLVSISRYFSQILGTSNISPQIIL